MRVIVAEEEEKVLTAKDFMNMDDGQLRARLAEVEAGEAVVPYEPGPGGLDEKRMIIFLLKGRSSPSTIRR